jgi:hypothetical protein
LLLIPAAAGGLDGSQAVIEHRTQHLDELSVAILVLSSFANRDAGRTGQYQIENENRSRSSYPATSV